MTRPVYAYQLADPCPVKRVMSTRRLFLDYLHLSPIIPEQSRRSGQLTTVVSTIAGSICYNNDHCPATCCWFADQCTKMQNLLLEDAWASGSDAFDWSACPLFERPISNCLDPSFINGSNSSLNCSEIRDPGMLIEKM
ncbi:hypothetical protein RRG08_065232 [Elysia crispata]|uniref:Uncharacterized protein n=1 Tax=Elysia crispata TaxID=231223 RepID=A0AAE1CYX9_9GAST|nr:hypothetical protein RRG08_065232 [Elysia crispata]